MICSRSVVDINKPTVTVLRQTRSVTDLSRDKRISRDIDIGIFRIPMEMVDRLEENYYFDREVKQNSKNCPQTRETFVERKRNIPDNLLSSAPCIGDDCHHSCDNSDVRVMHQSTLGCLNFQTFLDSAWSDSDFSLPLLYYSSEIDHSSLKNDAYFHQYPHYKRVQGLRLALSVQCLPEFHHVLASSNVYVCGRSESSPDISAAGTSYRTAHSDFSENTFRILLLLNIFDQFLCYGFSYNPFTIIVNKDSHLSIPCFSSSKQTQTKWIKYDIDFTPIELHNDTIHTISLHGILDIKNASTSHAYYQCICLFDEKIIFEKLFQIVTIGKYLTFNVESTAPFVELDDQFTVCSQLKADGGADLMWFVWTNNNMYNLSTFNDVIVSFNNCIRVLRFLPYDDLSFISCLLHKPDSKQIKTCDKPHHIRYSKWGKIQKILYFALKDRVILQCSYGGGNIDFYKDGKAIQFSESIKRHGNLLQIINASDLDSGHYECRFKKPSAMPYKLSIFLMNFSNISNSFTEMITNNEESSFILHCKNLLFEQSSEIFCHFNHFDSISHSLHLPTTISSDHMCKYKPFVNWNGLYQCLIRKRSNSLEMVSFYIQNLQPEPKLPISHSILKRRSVEDLTPVMDFKFTPHSNSIVISWSPPIMPVKTFTIYWGNMYPGPRKQVIDGKETKFVIESLAPESNYFIKIETDIVNGSVKSTLQPITTKKENKEINLSIPVNLKVVEVGDTWSKISWDHRDNGEPNNKTIYQVAFYPIRGQTGIKNMMNTSSTEIMIKNISPATTYEFMVQNCLVNSSKCSDWSMVLEFTSQETKPSDPPQHLTLSTIQLNNMPMENTLNKHIFAVQVSWQPPRKPNGEIKNYLILVTADRKLEMENWGERTVSGKTLNTVIDRLDLNRFYYFRIGCSNEYGRSPFSSIRIYKTPDEHGKNGGPIILSKEYYDAMEINEELKIQTSNERGTDNLYENNSDVNNKINSKNEKLALGNHKWWIVIGVVVGLTLVFILIILFLVASKCRNESIPYENGVKVFKSKMVSGVENRKQTGEVAKFISKGPILTTPDLFRHTNDQKCHQNFLEMDERTESPNSFSSNKGFSSQSHNATFASQQNYRSIPGHYTPPGLIHQQNMILATSHLTNNPNERQFYQVPFLHHMGHNPLNAFNNPAPRVNAAGSDFISINVPSPMSGYSDFTSSQATVLYDTSTAKSSGGKSSLSGSGSYNNGLGNKTSLINEPISEGYNSPDKNTELKQSKSADDKYLISKALSSEELSEEMANLEGLMKDLNTITQKEFEC